MTICCHGWATLLICVSPPLLPSLVPFRRTWIFFSMIALASANTLFFLLHHRQKAGPT
jgi:hypothetical protein